MNDNNKSNLCRPLYAKGPGFCFISLDSENPISCIESITFPSSSLKEEEGNKLKWFAYYIEWGSKIATMNIKCLENHIQFNTKNLLYFFGTEVVK